MRIAHNKKNILEIDRLPRITLRNMKPLFSKAKKLLSEDNDFFNNSRWIGYSLFYEDEKEIKVYYYPKEFRLLLRWEHEEEERKQYIYLVEVESNLGLSPILSFVCPYSGEVCRKLYTNWEIWIGRKGFHHTYSDRRKNKSRRIYTQIGNTCRKIDKIKEEGSGRTYYKGSFTKGWWRETKLINKANRLLSICKETDERRKAPIGAEVQIGKEMGIKRSKRYRTLPNGTEWYRTLNFL